MSHRDIINGQVVTPIILAALDADNTPAAQDLRGFNAARIDLGVGIGGITFTGTNKIEFELTVSDDNSTYTAVTDSDVIIKTSAGVEVAVASGGVVRSLTAAHAAPTVYRIGFKKMYAYAKLLANFGGSHAAATPIACFLVKGAPYVEPV